MSEYTPEQIRDISVEVYKIRLEQDCKNNVKWMLEKDAEKDPNDNGKKLRGRAAFYDVLTRVYLQVLDKR